MGTAEIIARHNARTHIESSQWSAQESGYVASHYHYFRKVRGMGVRAALEAAKALPAAYVKGREYRGNKAGFGAALDSGVRWTESAAESGLRFVGWSDELARCGHTGWFTFPDGCPDDTLRGGVWQWPGRNGEALLVPGYAEFDGRSEINPGRAAIDLGDITRTNASTGEMDIDDMRDVARQADRLAEIAAEQERDYHDAWRAGRDVGDMLERAESEQKAAESLRYEMSRSPVWQDAIRTHVWRDVKAGLVKAARLRREAREAREKWDSGYRSEAEREAFNEGVG